LSGLKKVSSAGLDVGENKQMIERRHPVLSIRNQGELIGLNRSTLYSLATHPQKVSPENVEIMRRIDES
jgi:hypothetical protein